MNTDSAPTSGIGGRNAWRIRITGSAKVLLLETVEQVVPRRVVSAQGARRLKEGLAHDGKELGRARRIVVRGALSRRRFHRCPQNARPRQYRLGYVTATRKTTIVWTSE